MGTVCRCNHESLFDANELGLIQEQMVANAKTGGRKPRCTPPIIANSFAFKGKNYEKDPDGTSESLGKFSVDATKSYYQINAG
jgi:hypothetical protein